MSAALRAEWTKLRTVPSTGWLLLAVVAGTVALGAAASAAVDPAHCATAATCAEDPVRTALTGVWLGQALVIVLAVVAVTNEYGSGLIRTTLAATPVRPRVLAAKVVVVTAAGLAAGAAGVAGSLLAGRALLPAGALALTDATTLRAAAGTVAYLGLVAAFSTGVAVLVRDTAAATAVALSVFYVAPTVERFVSDPDWLERLQRFSPSSVVRAVQTTVDTTVLPVGAWTALGVLAVYTAAAVAAATAAFAVRDAG